ncbi:MAG TPA: adenylyl-sulfate kinase [Vicinamibacterales bacterium]|nr:adenylyl-sulfate kinase [Vicinamibacterales bacterium]
MTGAILWFTGMSGAGKSTLAAAVGERLRGMRAVEILDGDAVRANLSSGLGFSREDRDTNVRRIGFVARLLARHGVFVIAAAISPYAAARHEVRRLAEADGLAFVEVFVNPSLQSLIARDVKGLYKRALAGELANFTGVSDPYEPPLAPDLEIRTDTERAEASAARILALLVERGLVPAHEPEPTPVHAPEP